MRRASCRPRRLTIAAGRGRDGVTERGTPQKRSDLDPCRAAPSSGGAVAAAARDLGLGRRAGFGSPGRASLGCWQPQTAEQARRCRRRQVAIRVMPRIAAWCRPQHDSGLIGC